MENPITTSVSHFPKYEKALKSICPIDDTRNLGILLFFFCVCVCADILDMLNCGYGQ